MGLFCIPKDDTLQEQLQAARVNLELYIEHRRNEMDESLLYLLKMARNQIETVEKALHDD